VALFDLKIKISSKNLKRNLYKHIAYVTDREVMSIFGIKANFKFEIAKSNIRFKTENNELHRRVRLIESHLKVNAVSKFSIRLEDLILIFK
jgi:hypothetical protein